MKNIIFLLFILIGLNASSQNTTIACYSYVDFTAADCPGCGLSDGLFSGLIITRPNGARFIISNPFSSKITGSQLIIADAYGKKVSIPLSRITLLNNSNNWSLSMYLNKCLCNPAGPSSASAIDWSENVALSDVDIDGYSLENVDSISFDNVTPILKATNDSLVFNGIAIKGVPSGGSTGQVLSKVNGTNYNTQWVTPSSVPTLRMLSSIVGTNPTVTNEQCSVTVTLGKRYMIKMAGTWRHTSVATARLNIRADFPSGDYAATAHFNTSSGKNMVTDWSTSIFTSVSSSVNLGFTATLYHWDFLLFYTPASSGTMTFKFQTTAGGATNTGLYIDYAVQEIYEF